MATDYTNYGAGYGIPLLDSLVNIQGGYEWRYNSYIEVIKAPFSLSNTNKGTNIKNMTGQKLYLNIADEQGHHIAADIKNITTDTGSSKIMNFTQKPTENKLKAIISLSSNLSSKFIPIWEQTYSFFKKVRDTSSFVKIQTTYNTLTPCLITNAKIMKAKGELAINIDLDYVLADELAEYQNNKAVKGSKNNKAETVVSSYNGDVRMGKID